MWGRALRLNVLGTKISRRNFLSASYGCEETWTKRSEGNPFWNNSPDDLYTRLEQRANQKLPISLVDVDVFMYCARPEHLGEVRDLLYKARSSAHTHLTLPSTSYSAIRVFSDADAFSELMHMLDDRLNYGLFLDRFTANMLFDKLLKRQDYLSAAKIAGFLMLQENFEGPITEQLALYSTFKYLQLPLSVKVPIVEETVKTPTKKKKIEEIKIRVRFLRNPSFDDHFDLTDDRMISGKTLAMITSKRDESTSRDCELLGWVFYKKIDKANIVARKLIEKGEIYKETVDRIRNVVENYDEGDVDGLKAMNDLLSTVQSIPVTDKSMEDEITNQLKKIIEEYEKNEINDHVQVLSSWEVLRSTKLQEQLERLEDMRKEQERKAREDKLKEIDEKISFFDNEEQLDLKIHIKSIEVRKPLPDKDQLKKSDDNYIPPNVRHNR